LESDSLRLPAAVQLAFAGFRCLCSLLRFIAHLKAMDSTPLFCGGASSGLGGCGRLVHSGISTSSDSTQQHWRGPGSGAVASVVSKVFLAGPTRGSVQCAALPVPTRGGGMCRVVRFFCFVFIFKRKNYTLDSQRQRSRCQTHAACASDRM
jgi:hypothetical protein